MVRNLFRFLYTEVGGLHQAAFLIGLSAFLSQLLALVRDRLLASTFGAGQTLDIYYTAFRIPDLVYVTIASFVAVTVLVPFIIKSEKESGREKVAELINKTFTLFCLVMILVSAVLFFAMPVLAKLIAPGFATEHLDLLVVMSRILLLSPFLLGISNLFGSVTQAFQKFYAYTLSPLLYNIGIIIGIIAFYPFMGILGLAWGVVLGALLHLLVQTPALLEAKVWPKLTGKVWDKEIKEIIFTSLPRTLTLATHQITIVVLVAMATLFVEGSVSVFNFALNLQSVPLAIIGVSYSVAAFPSLVKFISAGEEQKFIDQIVSALRHIIFWSFPIIAMFVVLRAQIVRVILGAGEFDWTETRLVAAALALFVISIAAQNLVQLFVRGYYAKGQTRKPLIINVASSLIVIISAFALVNIFERSLSFRIIFDNLLRVSDLPGTIVLMLPLAYSIGLIVNVFLYWFLFQKDFGRFNHAVTRTIIKSTAVAIFAGFVTQRALVFLSLVFDLNTLAGIFSQGFLAGLLGILSGLGLLLLIGSRELSEIKRSIKKKKIGKVIYPEKEEL